MSYAMKDIALFILLGLGAGAVIAGIAMAVVVTYSGSGIINLATGAVSMVAAYSFWAFKSDYFGFTLATAPAVVVTILVSVLVGVLSELLVFRPLRTSSPLAKLVASLGILLILQATVLLWFGSASKQIPSVFPTNFVNVFGTSIPGEQVLDGGDRGAHRARACGACTVGPGSVSPRGRRRRTRCTACLPACRRTSCRWPTR